MVMWCCSSLIFLAILCCVRPTNALPVPVEPSGRALIDSKTALCEWCDCVSNRLLNCDGTDLRGLHFTSDFRWFWRSLRFNNAIGLRFEWFNCVNMVHVSTMQVRSVVRFSCALLRRTLNLCGVAININVQCEAPGEPVSEEHDDIRPTTNSYHGKNLFTSEVVIDAS